MTVPSLLKRRNLFQSPTLDVVTTSEFPHDDVEDEEDDKNAKTGETPIYTVSLKTCVSPFNCTCLGKFIKPIYSHLLVSFSGHFGYVSTTSSVQAPAPVSAGLGLVSLIFN